MGGEEGVRREVGMELGMEVGMEVGIEGEGRCGGSGG